MSGSIGAEPASDREAPAETARIRLPGLFGEEDIGLGTLLKRMTSAAGIQPCEDCERRAEALNRLVAFARRSSDDATPDPQEEVA